MRKSEWHILLCTVALQDRGDYSFHRLSPYHLPGHILPFIYQRFPLGAVRVHLAQINQMEYAKKKKKSWLKTRGGGVFHVVITSLSLSLSKWEREQM